MAKQSGASIPLISAFKNGENRGAYKILFIQSSSVPSYQHGIRVYISGTMVR
jgi:hypothetical protein